jgi:hypothetical protein
MSEQAKPPKMTEQEAARVLEALGSPPRLPSSAGDGKRVLRAFFTARHGHPDKWGNFKISDSQRIQLGDVVVRVQNKHSKEAGGGWFNVQSKPIIDYSIAVAAMAAKILGREELVALAGRKRGARADAKKNAATKRAAAASKREIAENGPGFYVRNRARSIHGITADHERPFPTLEEAISFAKKRYEDFTSMRFDYLLPVTVVRASSRHEALFGDNHVYWIDGKFRGHPVDPRQLAMGFSGGRTPPPIPPGGFRPAPKGGWIPEGSTVGPQGTKFDMKFSGRSGGRGHLRHTFRSMPIGGVFRFRDDIAIYRKVDTNKYVLVGGDKTVYTQTRDKQVTYVTD